MARRRVLVAHLIAGRVGDEVNGLRRALGSGEIGRIAPHVTLVPPRNVDADLEPVLAHVRAVAASSGPGTVRLGGARVFLPARRVVHLGVDDRDGVYSSLAASLATGPLAPPARRDERPFVAHVTLNGRASRDVVDGALASLSSFSAEVAVAVVDLMALEDSTTPPRWHSVAAVELARPATSGRGGLEVEIVAATPSPAELDRLGLGSSPGGLAYVARVEGTVVGAVTAEVRGRSLLVRQHGVAPAYRNEGIGTRLLVALEARAASLGLAEVAVVVPAGTSVAGYYAGRGYLGALEAPIGENELRVRVLPGVTSSPEPGSGPGTVS